WEMRQTKLRTSQENFIEKISGFLEENPQASIAVYPLQYALKEKEYILFFEAKKKYFLSSNNLNVQSFNTQDSEKVNKMSVKDSAFVHYLNKQVRDSLIFTVQ